jgi:hypothetical protein
VVEAFAAQGPDERVLRSHSPAVPHRADDADVGAGEHRVEGGELGISARIKKRERSALYRGP